MQQIPSARPSNPTKNPQPIRSGAKAPAGPARNGSRSRSHPKPRPVLSGDARETTRSDGRLVFELECGVTVYPPVPGPEPGEGGKQRPVRWRAVWYEDGERQQCEAATEERLAVKLDKVTERLAPGAPNIRRPGAGLVAQYPRQRRRGPEQR